MPRNLVETPTILSWRRLAFHVVFALALLGLSWIVVAL